MMLPALDRLGPYDLIKNLTRPGRAEVYLGHLRVDKDSDAASAKELPELAVLKILRPPDQIDPSQEGRIQEAMARFIEEGRLGTRIRHPAITRTYGVGIDRRLNLHFIIQEYVEGITLAQVLDHCAAQEARLQFSVVLRLVIPILKALHYAYHDALREDGRPLRVVHRDIKPANIMLTYDGRVLLLDLASARSTSFTRQATVQDVVMGTAHYLSPEQVFDPDNVGHQTDIFATAVILFELCSLTPLLPRTRRLSEIAAALSRFNFADHAALIDPSLYPGLQEVLAQGLSPDPTTRYQTAGEMARQLDALLMQAGDGPGLSTFAADMRRQWEGNTDPVQEKGEDRIRSTGPGEGARGRTNLAGAEPVRAAETASPSADGSSNAGQVTAAAALAAASLAPASSSPEAEVRTSRSYLELAIAALLGVVIASATWFLLQVW